MKNIRGLLFISFIITIGFTNHTFAQQHAMNAMRVHQQAVRTHMHQAQQFQNMVLMNQHNRMIKKYSGKYLFNVVTPDGDTITATKKTKVEFFSPVKELTIKVDKEKKEFKPEDTKQIYFYQSKKKTEAIPYRDQWIFNTISTDKVKFYSNFPEPEIASLVLYQQPGDTIKEISVDDMKILMQGNEKALKDLEKKKLTNALSHYIKAEHKKEKDARKEEKQ